MMLLLVLMLTSGAGTPRSVAWPLLPMYNYSAQLVFYVLAANIVIKRRSAGLGKTIRRATWHDNGLTNPRARRKTG